MVKERLELQPLEKWIEGFQYVGKRRLADDERKFLAGNLSQASNPENMAIVGLFATAVVSLLAASGTGIIANGYFGPMLALSIIVTAIVPLMWTEQAKWYHEDLADLSLGEVEIYESGAAPIFSMRLVYLPRSNRVLSHEGHFLTQRRYLRVNLIAPPGHSRTDYFPQQFTLESGRLNLVRPLTGLEQSELEKILPKPHSWKWLMPAILWSWTFIGLGYLGEHGYDLATALRIGLLAVSALCLTVYYGLRSKRCARVRRDILRGTVVSKRLEGYEFELLAESELIWTVESTPASWRKRSLISKFCPMI